MRKVLAVLFFTLSTSLLFPCFGQNWEWVKGGKNLLTYGVQDPDGIATDTYGNIFEAGVFMGKSVYGNDTITYPCCINNYFIVKYDSNGNTLWVRDSRTTNAVNFATVTTDEHGNAYVAGNFVDSLIVGTYKFYSLNADAFLVKYSPNGNVVWARAGKTPSYKSDGGASWVATDGKSDIYITGGFKDTLAFGADTLITNSTNDDMFLVKYDTNGNVLWARTSKVLTAFDNIYAETITTDKKGSVFVAGGFANNVIFDTDTLTTNVGFKHDVFVAKYDTAGNFIWVKSAHVQNGQCNALAYSIATDNQDGVYITGTFGDTISFGSNILTSQTYSDIFIAKYNSNGGVAWAKAAKVGSSLYLLYGFSLATDNSGHLYASGMFQDSIVFGAVKLASDSTLPSFLIEFDTSGTALFGTAINNINDDENAVAMDTHERYVYFGGDVDSTHICMFGNDTLKGSGLEYSFVGKWQPYSIATGINNVNSSAAHINVFPIPSTGKFTVQPGMQNTVMDIEIYTIVGEEVYSQLTNPNPESTINLSALPNGIYFLKMQMQDGSTYVKKIEIVK